MCLTKYYVCFVVFFILHIIVVKSTFIKKNSKTIDELIKPKSVNRIKLEVPLPPKFLRTSNNLRYSNGNWETNDPIIDRICKKTGCSCGRSSLLCDAHDVFDVANDVVEVIDNIDRQIDKDEENANKFHDLLRCGIHGCTKLSDYHQQEKVSDSFTEDFNLDSTEQTTTGKNLLEAVLSELNDLTNSEKQDNHRLSTRVALTPEDIYEHYRAAMDQIRDTLMGFIKYRTGLTIVRGLPPDVRKGIQAIRDRYRHFKMSDKSLKKQIFQVFLDDLLKIKIVPNRNPDNTYDVFVPDWMYLEILKKKEGKRLRASKRSVQKRILPLTFQQKIRMQNQQGPKKLLKFIWRRSLGSDLSQYGVPFTLDIQGLGQLN